MALHRAGSTAHGLYLQGTTSTQVPLTASTGSAKAYTTIGFTWDTMLPQPSQLPAQLVSLPKPWPPHSLP